MEIKASVQRDQISFGSIDDSIEKDNPVRVIEAFVEHIDLKELGFEIGEEKAEGRPSYNAKVFLKLYFYGYLNGLRSSRKLAKECARNIEVQWLLCKLMPNYHSISDFRKNNPKALRNTFKLFVLFLKDADLVSGDLIAIDGTKVRANNSKKNNFSVSKIDRHIEYIENKTNEYLAQLDQNDTPIAIGEEPLKINNVSEKIARLAGNKIKYELLKEKLIESNDTQLSEAFSRMQL